MELSSSNIKQILIFPEMKPRLFSPSSKNKKIRPEKYFIYFRKRKPQKNFLYFLKRRLFLYFRKRNFLTFRERYIQNPGIFRTGI